jgi:hypothetical protein
MNVNDIKTVAMIGAGDMGHGIAEVALLAGYRVNLYDIKDDFVELGKKRIFESLDLLTGKGKIPAELDRAIREKLLKTTTDLGQAVGDADQVIEDLRAAGGGKPLRHQQAEGLAFRVRAADSACHHREDERFRAACQDLGAPGEVDRLAQAARGGQLVEPADEVAERSGLERR